MTYIWLIGVFIYCTGTFGESLGANLQRMSVRRENKKPEEDRRELSDQGYHRVGFWCFVCSGIFMSFALFFATTTQLAPMQLFMFMSNFVFAHYLNHEPFNWRTDGVAATCVAVGVIACVVVAPKESHNYDEDDMLDLMQKFSFYVFVSSAGGFILGTFAMKHIFLKQAAGDLSTLSPLKQNLTNMSFGSLAGALGGVNVTLTKVTFSMIGGQWQDDGIVGIFKSPLLWGTAMFLVMTYIAQIYVTVDGLEACSAIIVMSTHSVIEEVFATLGGVLWFEDYKHFSALTASIFICGQTMAIVAVIILSYLRLGIEQEKARLATPLSTPAGTPRGSTGPQSPPSPTGVKRDVNPAFTSPDQDEDLVVVSKDDEILVKMKPAQSPSVITTNNSNKLESPAGSPRPLSPNDVTLDSPGQEDEESETAPLSPKKPKNATKDDSSSVLSM